MVKYNNKFEINSKLITSVIVWIFSSINIYLNIMMVILIQSKLLSSADNSHNNLPTSSFLE
jgi:hypothetical protein